MAHDLACDESLIQRLPLPLAQLYRRAHNAKTPLDRHLTAYYLWEATLKLLASAAVVEYAERRFHEPELAECRQNLARPAVGHWWEFVRRLLPVLGDAGDGHFGAARELVLGRARDDLPRTAGLDAALTEALEGSGGARATVRLTELFDRLVRYRNREVGHGAAGQRPVEFYDRMGRALLAGLAELLGRLDVLAGRRLLYVPEVRRHASGQWLVERYELVGETGRRIESLALAESETARRLLPERVYLEAPPGQAAAGTPDPALHSLHPLLVYDPAGGDVLFLNARRGLRRIEYLCYRSGDVGDRSDLGQEQRALLTRVLGLPVEDHQLEHWGDRARSREQAANPPVPADEAAGSPYRTLGEFELLSELGRGGMGVVYRAWQPSLGRQVALKVLFRTGDPKAEARFAREIHALGRVEHPHLIKIFTSGSDGDQWFYAMELVEGATLGAVCERLASRGADAGALDWPTWRGTLSTVCEEARQAEKPLSGVGHGGAAPRRTGVGGRVGATGGSAGRPGLCAAHRRIGPAGGPGGARAARVRGDSPRHQAGQRDGDGRRRPSGADGPGAGATGRRRSGPADKDAPVRGHAALRQPGASGRRRPPGPAERRLQLGSDAVGVADAAPAVRGDGGDADAGGHPPHPADGRRVGAAVQRGGVGGLGSGGAEVSGEGRAPTLRQRRRSGGRARAGCGGRAGAGAARRAAGAGLALVPAQPGSGRLAGGGGG